MGMCSCPLDGLNVSRVLVPVSWSHWKRVDSGTGLGLRGGTTTGVEQVDSVPVSTGSVGQLPHREQPSVAEMDSVSTGRSFAAVSLTVVLAWLVLRNLYSWHRNLPAVSVGKASSSSALTAVTPRGGGRSRNRHGRPWLPTANTTDGWSDYEADESETPSAADIDDTEPLFLPAPPEHNDDEKPLPLTIVHCCQCCAVIQEGPLDDDVSSMDCDLPSLSYDDEDTAEDEHAVLTDEEPPLEQSPLICSSLAFCYLNQQQPDCNNNDDDDDDSVDSRSDEESYHSFSSANPTIATAGVSCGGVPLSTCASSSSCCSFASAGTDGLLPWDWPPPSITGSSHG